MPGLTQWCFVLYIAQPSLHEWLSLTMASDTRSDLGLRCIHCGRRVDELFYRIGQDICLSQCQCGEVADHYIEFEILLVFIDMQLLQPKVYRHVIFNRFSARTLRMESLRFLLFCLFLDAYTRWASLPSSPASTRSSRLFQHADWAVLVVTLVETASYFLCVSYTALLLGPFRSNKSWRSWEGHRRIWEALIISSFGKVFKLVPLIWGGFSGETDQTMMATAVMLFIAACNVTAVQTVLEDSDCRWAAVAVAFGCTLQVGIELYCMAR